MKRALLAAGAVLISRLARLSPTRSRSKSVRSLADAAPDTGTTIEKRTITREA